MFSLVCITFEMVKKHNSYLTIFVSGGVVKRQVMEEFEVSDGLVDMINDVFFNIVQPKMFKKF